MLSPTLPHSPFPMTGDLEPSCVHCISFLNFRLCALSFIWILHMRAAWALHFRRSLLANALCMQCSAPLLGICGLPMHAHGHSRAASVSRRSYITNRDCHLRLARSERL
ncbi:hypothetical protein FIBSPDRAFT_151744 [Athelia psychrophila]|uniref:Uncharacterized protein n=1 Tax=Athelia psychrophila TaxID=1759441 RepID=A0A166BJ55_9AGAM|nr:hypothetical protein FIBSPDRAFT_151744 [Fibularhizoctonia sp. CBS 109695]